MGVSYFYILIFKMYDLKIFDTLEEMGRFLTAQNITDYTFKVFDFKYL